VDYVSQDPIYTQISLFCTEALEATLDTIEKVRTRSPRGGYYQLFQVIHSKGTDYFLVVTTTSSLNVFPCDDEQIEAIFGYEAVPDRSKEGTP